MPRNAGLHGARDLPQDVADPLPAPARGESGRERRARKASEPTTAEPRAAAGPGREHDHGDPEREYPRRWKHHPWVPGGRGSVRAAQPVPRDVPRGEEAPAWPTPPRSTPTCAPSPTPPPCARSSATPAPPTRARTASGCLAGSAPAWRPRSPSAAGRWPPGSRTCTSPAPPFSVPASSRPSRCWPPARPTRCWPPTPPAWPWISRSPASSPRSPTATAGSLSPSTPSTVKRAPEAAPPTAHRRAVGPRLPHHRAPPPPARPPQPSRTQRPVLMMPDGHTRGGGLLLALVAGSAWLLAGPHPPHTPDLPATTVPARPVSRLEAPATS